VGSIEKHLSDPVMRIISERGRHKDRTDPAALTANLLSPALSTGPRLAGAVLSGTSFRSKPRIVPSPQYSA